MHATQLFTDSQTRRHIGIEYGDPWHLGQGLTGAAYPYRQADRRHCLTNQGAGSRSGPLGTSPSILSGLSQRPP
jgi:hypothetical protein